MPDCVRSTGKIKNMKNNENKHIETFEANEQQNHDKKPILLMLVGLPGSGKSTYCKTYKNFKVHSSDALREELFGDESCQDKNALAMNMKYFGRHIESFKCKKCLMKEFGWSKEDWDSKVEGFKRQGCQLF